MKKIGLEEVPGRILMIRCCPMDVFRKSFEKTREVFPYTEIAVFAQRAVLTEVQAIDGVSEVILAPDGMMSCESMGIGRLEELRASQFDVIMIAFPHLNSGGVENVYEVARALRPKMNILSVYPNGKIAPYNPQASPLSNAAITQPSARDTLLPPTERDYSLESGERQVAPQLSQIRLDHRLRYEFAANCLAQRFPGKERVFGLDAFCATGYGSLILHERLGCSILGIDASTEAIAFANMHYAAGGILYAAKEFPFDLPGKRFDFIVSLESIEHVKQPFDFLRALSESLDDNGLLILSAPNSSELSLGKNPNLFHNRHFTRGELCGMAEKSGLRLVSWHGQNLYNMREGKAEAALKDAEMLVAPQSERQLLIYVFEKDIRPGNEKTQTPTKALLIVPPVRLATAPNRFPHGLACIAASLELAGLDVSILDLNLLRLSPQEEEQKIAEAVQGADVVGTGGMITTFKTIRRIVSCVKEHRPDLPVVVGGALSSHLQELILENSRIDVLAMGEGELIAPKLFIALAKGCALGDIAGLAYMERGVLRKTAAPERISDLDALPMPAYHLFDTAQYIRNRSRGMDIVTSRGCPFQCSFCYRNFGRRVVGRSIPNIIREIRFLTDTYGIQHVYLEDELFVLRPDRVREFCEQIREIGLTWGACARANTLSQPLLEEMKKSGCAGLMIGFESFDDNLLEEMDKNISAGQNHRTCEWMNLAGINIWPGLIIGMPGETKDTVERTVRACVRHGLNITEWSYAFATPYPGTKLYEGARGKGLIPDEWQYLLHLCDVGDTCNLTLNLTSYSDEDLIELRNNAVKTVAQENSKSTDAHSEHVFGQG